MLTINNIVSVLYFVLHLTVYAGSEEWDMDCTGESGFSTLGCGIVAFSVYRTPITFTLFMLGQISLLIPLVKNGELIVPGFSEPLKAPHRFKMFCTLRYSQTKTLVLCIAVHNATLLGKRPTWERKCTQISSDHFLPTAQLFTLKLVLELSWPR